MEVIGRQGRRRTASTASRQRVRLLSRACVPAEHDAGSPDHRPLGVAVAALTLDGRNLPLVDPRLAGGWHTAEPGWRWTTGDALVLTPPGARLEVRLAPICASYWVDPTREQEKPKVAFPMNVAPTTLENR